jgi:acyl transferase domain-containing protein
MQNMELGRMLAVFLGENELKCLVKEDVSIATINGPSLCVISGPVENIEKYEKAFAEKDIGCRRLVTSHAFHSMMMEPMLSQFSSELKNIKLNTPQIPYVSNLTGKWITDEEATSPDYWCSHLRKTVRFSDGIKLLLGETSNIMLEIGPGTTLSSLAKYHSQEHVLLSSIRSVNDKTNDQEFLLAALGKMWVNGAEIEWKGFYGEETHRRVVLPTYPFQRRRYWIEQAPMTGSAGYRKTEWEESDIPEESSITEKKPERTFHKRPDLSTPYVEYRNDIEKVIVEHWEEALGINGIGVKDNFYEMGGHSLLTTQILTRLQEKFPLDIPVQKFYEAQTVEDTAKVIVSALAEMEDDDDFKEVLKEIDT